MSGTGTNTWHVPSDLLVGFHDGSIGPVDATSVEAHLVSCDRCRNAVADLRASRPDAMARADAVWERIADHVDRPSRRFAGRGTWAVVTLGTPALRLAAAAAVVLVAVLPLVLDTVSERLAIAAFVTIAPLVPLGGVLAAFRPAVDPAGEMSLATPLATMRLVLLRAVVIAVAALPLAVVVAVVLPASTPLLLGWVLPGLALALVATALSRLAPVDRVVPALCLVWAAVATTVLVELRRGSVSDALESWVVNQPAVQVACALVAVVAAVASVAQRDDTVVVWGDR
jgi:hypothetical protein